MEGSVLVSAVTERERERERAVRDRRNSNRTDSGI